LSLINDLPAPLSTIVIENEVGSYKDFRAASDYPLKGVTYHAEYGYLPGYTGEDGDCNGKQGLALRRVTEINKFSYLQ
jgi:hypothetical protein